VTVPLPRPDLTPRRALFWTALGVFAVWFAFLAWVYVSQILVKKA
jgi:hypothetical protein